MVLAGNDAVTEALVPVTAGAPPGATQAWLVGVLVQEATSDTGVAVPATKLLGFAVSVQTGTDPGGFTVTVAVAAVLVPVAVVAVTEYVYVPATVEAGNNTVAEFALPSTAGAPPGETQL